MSAEDFKTIGNVTAELMDAIEEDSELENLHLKRVLLIVELGDDDGSLIYFRCSDRDCTAQAGLIGRALTAATEGDDE
jgi:hypothetical protein